MKKIGFLTLSLALLMVCGAVFASAANDPVVIQSGNRTILLSEAQAYFDDLYAKHIAFYTNYGQSITAEDIQQIRNDTISALSLRALLDNKIVEYGLDEISDADKQALWDESNAIYDENALMEAEVRGVPVEQVKEERAAFGMTAEFQYNSMLEMLPYNRLLNHVTESVAVDDTALQRAYDTYVQQDKELYANDILQYEFDNNYANVNALYRPEGYRSINYILLPIPEALDIEIQNAQAELLELSDIIAQLEEELKTIGNGTSSRTAEQVNADLEQKQREHEAQSEVCEALQQQILPQIQGTLEAINAKLNAGESFESLIPQYARDESFPVQEDGTCYVHKESLLFDDAFRDAAMAIAKVGDFSAPILTDHGIYIIKYIKDVPGGAVPMSKEVAETLRGILLEDAKNAYYEEMMKQWQQQATIETHPELIVLPDANALPVQTMEGTVENPAEDDGSIG